VNLSITLEQPDKKLALFGSADKNLRLIRDAFGVQLVSRDNELRLGGESAVAEKRYKEFGGTIMVIVREGEGHFLLSPKDPKSVVDFITSNSP
jgi:phosphate starvation-inducible protein PhoH